MSVLHGKVDSFWFQNSLVCIEPVYKPLFYVSHQHLHCVWESDSDFSSDPWDVPHRITTPIKGTDLPRTFCLLTSTTPLWVKATTRYPRIDVPRRPKGTCKLDPPPRRTFHLSFSRSRSYLGSRKHWSRQDYLTLVSTGRGLREVLWDLGQLVVGFFFVSVERVSWPRVDKTSGRKYGRSHEMRWINEKTIGPSCSPGGRVRFPNLLPLHWTRITTSRRHTSSHHISTL